MYFDPIGRNEKPEKLDIVAEKLLAVFLIHLSRKEKPERVQKRIFEKQEMPTITEQFQFSDCWHFFNYMSLVVNGKKCDNNTI